MSTASISANPWTIVTCLGLRVISGKVFAFSASDSVARFASFAVNAFRYSANG
jgi:hypothetical protein